MKLRRVASLMHAGEDLPKVGRRQSMPDVIYEMSRKGLGLAAVAEANLEACWGSSRTEICGA
jgi:arabinose-5-phosphate isomerase